MTRRTRHSVPRDTRAFPLSDTPSQRDLADALGQFLRAADWLAGLRVLLSHPVLFTERAINLLSEGAEASRRRGNTADEVMMLTHIAFLHEVRQRGVFAVLSELYDKDNRS